MPSTIEVFSDFVCPFCYLAEQPLADAVEGTDVHISWQPFELRPEPTPTLRPEGNYLQSTWQQVVYPMAERMGVPIVLPRISPQPYSRLAFEGFAFAAERGLGQRYTEQVFRAFFVRQRDIGRPDVLTDVATQLGLDPEDFRAALDSGRYAAAHQRALRRAQELDITVVPTILLNGRRLEGMPSAQALHQLLNEAVTLSANLTR
ncbi:MAG: DsbA family oxidoreductase [Pseudonocardiales bacterium]|nr:DsbA family oxidoreductase [Pseudonocardiales bacterium]MBV9650811.1 DsbA family oxidoreductase [Pseudonocardiales bacterium]